MEPKVLSVEPEVLSAEPVESKVLSVEPKVLSVEPVEPKVLSVDDRFIYQPVRESLYFDGALKYFFSNATLNRSAVVPIDFMDFFPLCQRGWALKLVTEYLMGGYVFLNNLVQRNDLDESVIIPDKLFTDAFGDVIPATYYVHLPNGVMHDNYDYELIDMTAAIQQGLIDRPLNTFEVLQSMILTLPDQSQSSFKPDAFPYFWLFRIFEVNYTNLTLFPNANDFITNDDFMYHLVQEAKLADDLYRIIDDRRPNTGSFDVYDYIASTTKPEIRTLLLSDNRLNKLYVAIINKNLAQVVAQLQTIDPRDDKHRAYFLAMASNDSAIINAVTDNIIRRNIIENEVITDLVNVNTRAQTDLSSLIRQQVRRPFS